ncbi:MAG: peptidylprolyl isomerase [Candidatus Latescibacteria bacterium]|nr:peptidylprolyl isomerase [bacterium]MBD3423504.1 peptidylprolyl isomerase [Candidatus Latescibacterota bacterium]
MKGRTNTNALITAILACTILSSAAAGQDTAAVDTSMGGGDKRAAADTLAVIRMEGGGTVKFEFMPEKAPLAVRRIKELIISGFYNGLEFHRVEPYLVQTGRKEHDYPVVSGEMFSQYIKHEAGMIGMARLPSDYDSATTQFYICKRAIPSINGEYTLFARVVEGMDVVKSIEEGDRIESCFLSAEH